MMHFIPVLVTLILLALPALAEGLSDVPGSADPEGLPRIEGAVIIGYDQSGFDEFSFPTGKMTWDGPEATQTLEGPRTRILYVVPGDRSPLEVVRNYEAELAEQGYEPRYACGKGDCGPLTPMVGYLYPREGRLENMGQITRHAFSMPRDDQRYMTARNRETGRFVSVYTAFESFDHHPETADQVLVLLDVVDSAPLTRRMEFVSAEEMALSLGADGRVSLYGVQFAHDSDALTPESDPTLAEIAKFLAASPAITVFVVGHTDMTGGYEYNLDLSGRRAASVVAALTGRYGVAAARLEPAGVGPLAPVAENLSDDGRALNRRVELVQR